MNDDIVVAIVAGAFAIVGAAAGVGLGAWTNRLADNRRLRAEDERRWLMDRRQSYAKYLALVLSLLQEIERFATFLPGSIESISPEDEGHIRESLNGYWEKWESQLQPALGEVQLLASPRVAELAERASAATMEITSPVEQCSGFDEYYPGWFQAQDLLDVLRNAMREELGLVHLAAVPLELRRSSEWPWLTERPHRDSYRQSRRSLNVDESDNAFET